MKSRLFLLPMLFLMILFLSACSSDDDALTDQDPQIQKLIGKRLHEEIIVNEVSSEGTSEILEFQNNRKLVITDEDGKTSTGSYTLEGDQLSLTSEELTSVVTLQEVTEKELQFYLKTNYDGEGELDDVTVIFSKM